LPFVRHSVKHHILPEMTTTYDVVGEHFHNPTLIKGGGGPLVFDGLLKDFLDAEDERRAAAAGAGAGAGLLRQGKRLVPGPSAGAAETAGAGAAGVEVGAAGAGGGAGAAAAEVGSGAVGAATAAAAAGPGASAAGAVGAAAAEDGLAVGPRHVSATERDLNAMMASAEVGRCRLTPN